MGELQYNVEMILRSATFSVCASSGNKVQGVRPVKKNNRYFLDASTCSFEIAELSVFKVFHDVH